MNIVLDTVVLFDGVVLVAVGGVGLDVNVVAGVRPVFELVEV